MESFDIPLSHAGVRYTAVVTPEASTGDMIYHIRMERDGLGHREFTIQLGAEEKWIQSPEGEVSPELLALIGEKIEQRFL